MIGNDWDKELEVIWNSPNFQKVYNHVLSLYDKETIYPSKEDIFRALKLTPYNKVKVVIMGQDPYHGEGEAMGLSFSVHKGIKLPPSLKIIYNEIYDDIGIIEPTSAHPSPFSCRYGFFGSKPFSKTNEFLKKNGIEPVDWQL